MMGTFQEHVRPGEWVQVGTRLGSAAEALGGDYAWSGVSAL